MGLMLSPLLPWLRKQLGPGLYLLIVSWWPLLRYAHERLHPPSPACSKGPGSQAMPDEALPTSNALPGHCPLGKGPFCSRKLVSELGSLGVTPALPLTQGQALNRETPGPE